MKLIDEIEISYFRSFYKFTMKDFKDLNVIFGKNDSGKSNVVRAISLFFSGRPEHSHPFEFPIEFSEQRLNQTRETKNKKKFISVKITFITPESYQNSLQESFYVRRMWAVSRGRDFVETVSGHIPKNKRYIVTRLINRIKFIHIPAIKDIRILQMLLENVHETISEKKNFQNAVKDFSGKLQELTHQMFEDLPSDVSTDSRIGAPKQLNELFQTLDFETKAEGDSSPKSLTRQRGDGVKMLHIPELLRFISQNDEFEFHIWGFEEPENSLDFVATQSVARRMCDLAEGGNVQVLMTTHHPSFYLLERSTVAKYYIVKDSKGFSNLVQGNEINSIDAQSAMEEGFYLPAVAEAVSNVANLEDQLAQYRDEAERLNHELAMIKTPVVLTEGRTDVSILRTAWEKRRGNELLFAIRSCESGGSRAGSGDGGATKLAKRIEAISSDNPHTVIALFDRDETGCSAYEKLNRNFSNFTVGGFTAKRGLHGRSYASLLPVPSFRREFAEYANLPIEFFFHDEQIFQSLDGKGLWLESMTENRTRAGRQLTLSYEDKPYFKCIKGDKVHFADCVVPSFESEAFREFDQIFDLIEAIVEYDKLRDS